MTIFVQLHVAPIYHAMLVMVIIGFPNTWSAFAKTCCFGWCPRNRAIVVMKNSNN